PGVGGPRRDPGALRPDRGPLPRAAARHRGQRERPRGPRRGADAGGPPHVGRAPDRLLQRRGVEVRRFVALLPLTWAPLVALACGSLLILAVGGAPAEVYRLLFAGTWGNAYGVGQVLFKATPLIFTGLAVAVALRAGLFNIGAEGQLTVGAFATAALGAALP